MASRRLQPAGHAVRAHVQPGAGVPRPRPVRRLRRHQVGRRRGRERELAFELEYAFTRRIGVVVEAPLVYLNPEDGDTEQGLGDAAIAPRALLVETDRFLLSGNLEITLPTGSESKGLGSGEVAVAPSISTWLDLGNWITFSTQVGTEHGLETGDSELFYAAALTYSFHGPALFDGEADAHDAHAGAHDHFGPGLTSLIVEFTGRTVLSGDDRDRSTAEVLFGVSHVLTENARGPRRRPTARRRRRATSSTGTPSG